MLRTLWRSTDMFDALCLSDWYVWQGVSWHVWHVWACTVAVAITFGSCFRRSTDMFDFCFFDMFGRSYPDMFWHVWACTVAVARTLILLQESTDMFDFCFFDMFVRSYPDMFWHVWTCAVAVAITFDLGCLPGALQLNGPHEMICTKWQKRIVWRQPSPDNLHPTCHGGDHSK